MWTSRKGQALTWDVLLALAALLFFVDALRNRERLYTSLFFALMAAGVLFRRAARRVRAVR
jgi:hypothetical protein